VFFDEVGDEIEDVFLPLGERHGSIVGEEKGKIKDQKNYLASTTT
jgi:hypothetical protein